MVFPIVMAILVTAAAAAAYVFVLRRRGKDLQHKGFGLTTQATIRRHIPYAMFLAALPLLLIGLGRPQAQISVPHVAGTVMLVIDVSKSMSADDIKPTRLAAAQVAAANFVKAQPRTVDIGVVMFGAEGLTTQAPTADHAAVLGAIERLRANGGTSLTRAILAALSTITGKQVELPNASAQDQPNDLGYWGSATIVLFSDGQDQADPLQTESAAQLAADAGVRIETVGIGTPEGTTVEVDGYQVATALDQELLTAVATTTGGSYHPAEDASALNQIHRSIDLRLTTKPQPVELTALFAGAALVLLTVGAVLMLRWHGRIV